MFGGKEKDSLYVIYERDAKVMSKGGIFLGKKCQKSENPPLHFYMELL